MSLNSTEQGIKTMVVPNNCCQRQTVGVARGLTRHKGGTGPGLGRWRMHQAVRRLQAYMAAATVSSRRAGRESYLEEEARQEPLLLGVAKRGSSKHRVPEAVIETAERHLGVLNEGAWRSIASAGGARHGQVARCG